MTNENTLRIFNETKQHIPRKTMRTIFSDLLKKKYSLVVVCIGDAYSKNLNAAYRNKKRPTNVLTFPPGESKVAEIYINTKMAEREAKNNNISVKKQLLFFYIHGVLHLLGHHHSTEMETLEDRYVTKYT